MATITVIDNSGATVDVVTVDNATATIVVTSGDLTPSQLVKRQDFTAKGQLVVGTANDAFAILPAAGANDKVLLTDSATSTGVKWADAPSSGHVIENSGTPLAQRTTINFLSGIVASDDSGNDETDVNIDFGTAAEIADIGTVESAGSSDKLPRADHVHNHPTITTGNLHSEYVQKSTLDAKGDIFAATANDTPARLAVGADGKILRANAAQSTGLEYIDNIHLLPPYMVTGPVYVHAGNARIYLDRNYTIVSVRASVGTAPTGSTILVDVNKNGTTIFTTQSNRPTIAASGFTDLADAINVSSLAAGDYLTVDVDQIGSTVAGSDLTVQIVLAEVV